MKTRFIGSRVFPCGRTDGRTDRKTERQMDRHAEAHSRFSQFCEGAYWPELYLQLQSVPRSKHSFFGYETQSVYAL
jgi:hypothetical protein